MREEIIAEIMLLSAQLQLVTEKIDSLSKRKTIFKQSLKQKANSFQKELDKVLSVILEDKEGSQIQALNLATLLECAYNPIVEELVKTIKESSNEKN